MPETAKLDELEEMIYREAESLLAKNPNWVTFYRETFGPTGIVRRTFNSPDALAQFERTETCAKIQQMLAGLRRKSADRAPEHDHTKIITIRIPRSIHEALRREAYDYQTSMNKLCISKLLRLIDPELIPNDRSDDHNPPESVEPPAPPDSSPAETPPQAQET
jgi:predicted HicB family RNase H-like nuclease